MTPATKDATPPANGAVPMNTLHDQYSTRSAQCKFAMTSFSVLKQEHPELRPYVIQGMLRIGETMNLIGAPKSYKSWAAMDLAMAVASGGRWMDTYRCEQGGVLLIDNELHVETITSRADAVRAARGLPDSIPLMVSSLRGNVRSIDSMIDDIAEACIENSIQLIIIDALYRALPAGISENDNAAVAAFMNRIDNLARKSGCSIVMVHHASKGNQSGRSITDVGSGAGAFSRSADVHTVIRPHRTHGVFVMQSTIRSSDSLPAACFRWEYPRLALDEESRPDELLGPRGKAGLSKADIQGFVSRFVTEEGSTVRDIHRKAEPLGYSESFIRSKILKPAVSLGLVEERPADELRKASKVNPYVYRRAHSF